LEAADRAPHSHVGVGCRPPHRATAEAMARRGGAGASLDRYALQLEDQSGNPINFVSETDKYALVTGLVLHAAGKRQLADGDHRAALETLTSGEEAFQLCNSAHLKVRAHVREVSGAAFGRWWCPTGSVALLGVWSHPSALHSPLVGSFQVLR
jgi:hypothetical protein